METDMTRTLIATTLIATLGTAAAASGSDRYTDLRLNTAVSEATIAETAASTEHAQPTVRSITVSTRSANRNAGGSPYHYANPLGVGPYNDSR